jgi:hypothetical protein
MGVQASNYPPSFYQEHLLLATKGPALISFTYSGYARNGMLIGYKKSGIFGQKDKLDVIINALCSEDYYLTGRTFNKQALITITPEWQGNGLLSYPLDMEQLLKKDKDHLCIKILKIELAFSSDNEWDSLYGKNYVFESEEIGISFFNYPKLKDIKIISTGASFMYNVFSERAWYLIGQELSN